MKDFGLAKKEVLVSLWLVLCVPNINRLFQSRKFFTGFCQPETTKTMRTAASIFAIGQWINGIVDLWCMNIAGQLTPQRTYESEALQSRIDHRILAA